MEKAITRSIMDPGPVSRDWCGEGHQQPPHTMGDVRPHGSGRARPVLRRGYAPDGRVHSLCTLRIPVICVRGDAVQAMNGV